MLHAAVIKAVEAFANPNLQESWDNTGLQVGSLRDECTGVLVCLDPTPAVVDEAKKLGCNLIVSHHPLFFKAVKRLTGATLPEATAINAIADGITIYSTHTASDSTLGGVSYTLARKLGIEPLRTLSPLEGRLVRLQAIVPKAHAYEVEAALFDAGAGKLGNYDCCSFSVEGRGTFRALDGAEPYVGEIGENHTEEVEISVVLASELMGAVEKALIDAHPYETPAYAFTPMLNKANDLGLGIYGTLDEGMDADAFVEHVKSALGCKAVRCTKVDYDKDIKIRRVAVCGGAGGEFIGRALAMGAQAYVTADVRYHDFVDYRDRILVIDAGHYETEAPIKEVLCQVIKDALSGIPAYCTTTHDNPINYL